MEWVVSRENSSWQDTVGSVLGIPEAIKVSVNRSLNIWGFPGLKFGEGDGNPVLQYSCLENPMDRGAW